MATIIPVIVMPLDHKAVPIISFSAMACVK